MIRSEVENARYREGEGGAPKLVLEGFFFAAGEDVVLLQLGLPGGPLVPAERCIREDLADAWQEPAARFAGFRAELPFLDLADRLFVCALLRDGYSLVASHDVRALLPEPAAAPQPAPDALAPRVLLLRGAASPRCFEERAEALRSAGCAVEVRDGGSEEHKQQRRPAGFEGGTLPDLARRRGGDFDLVWAMDSGLLRLYAALRAARREGGALVFDAAAAGPGECKAAASPYALADEVLDRLPRAAAGAQTIDRLRLIAPARLLQSDLCCGDVTSPWSGLEQLLSVGTRPVPAAPQTPLEIIIPIYNAYDEAKRCIESVLANSDLPGRLLLIDDASSDERIAPLLDQVEAAGAAGSVLQIRVLRNRENLGFVRTVNRALRETRGDVVLLNSDTEVPPAWLSRLYAPLAADRRIASVTPFSNAATICSFPGLLHADVLLKHWNVAKVDSFFERFAPAPPLELPTGVGFCMLLNRAALEAIGSFDAALFAPMYGEENDWCLRAAARGFRNVLVPNLFVHHADSASLRGSAEMERKHARQLTAGAKLEILFPGYDAAVSRHARSDPAGMLKLFLALLMRAQQRDLPGLLVIHNPDLTGGCSRFLERYLRDTAHLEQPYVLELREETAALYAWDGEQDRRTPLRLPLDWRRLDRSAFRKLARLLALRRAFINHLYRMPAKSVFEQIATLPLPYDFYAHDYYAACPRVMLLRADGEYCGGEICAAECERCLAEGGAAPAGTDGIEGFRRFFENILARAERVFVPSSEAKELLERYYPRSPFVIWPPPPPPHLRMTYDLQFALDPQLTVAAVGALGPHKGSAHIYSLARALRAAAAPVTVKVIGYTELHHAPYREDGLEILGAYEAEDISSLLARHRAAVVLSLSICPETYCYTAAEAMLSGFPVVSFDLGAVPGRIRRSRGGWIIPPRNDSDLLALILRLAAERSEIRDKALRLQAYNACCFEL